MTHSALHTTVPHRDRLLERYRRTWAHLLQATRSSVGRAALAYLALCVVAALSAATYITHLSGLFR